MSKHPPPPSSHQHPDVVVLSEKMDGGPLDGSSAWKSWVIILKSFTICVHLIAPFPTGKHDASMYID